MTRMGFKKSFKQHDLAYWHKRVWKVFSQFIRLRDSDANGYCKCISCSHIGHWKTMDAGHYISKGESSYLRYNEINVNAQCGRCNMNEGNSADYREWLIEKYGIKEVEKLEATKKYPGGYTKDGLKLMYEKYLRKVKEMEKCKV